MSPVSLPQSLRGPALGAASLAAGLLVGAGCLQPVAELYCTGDAECAVGARCDAGQCFWADGGPAPGADGGQGGGADAGSCGAQSCAGCCRAGACLPGAAAAACGLGGRACATCPAGGTCAAGECLGGDGGVSAIGGPCTASVDCAGAASCVPEVDFSGATGFPGGICVQLCTPSSPCPAGSRCVAGAVKGVLASLCLGSCPAPGGQSTCRTGYRCLPGADGGYCRPDCGTGALTGCTAPQTCDTATGQCR